MPDNEKYFFQNLSAIVGSNLIAKSIGKNVTRNDVFLDKDFRRHGLPHEIELMFAMMLKELLSTGSIGSGSLSHHVDGMFINHTKYGSRIIEFDEEQHFTPFRSVSLRYVSSQVKTISLTQFQVYYRNVDYFNRMLRKHRLKVTIKEVPETVNIFISLIQNYARQSNGYIEPKTGFNFVGGRIAQRAYYDSLKDIAHLSPTNSHLDLPLRFSMFEFEEEACKRFNLIPQNQLRTMIEHRLYTLAN